MKYLLILIAFVTSNVLANTYHRPPHPHGHWVKRGPEWHWVVPAVVGGVIVYQATTPRVHPLTNTELQTCSPWTEIQNPDGTITRTRTCNY